MTDPAVEAARKAGTGWLTGEEAEVAEGLKVIAAREALKPIRERHAHWVAELEKSPLPATAGAIALVVLADLAPLIFTTEEINQ
ncbi:hypothetical protein PP563_09905 [Mycobacteroides abscessus]|nr:hypothetical protein [Mycobacteroides abscessus]MDM2387296.1 hypothetical protein [Mycobacteroides abscessus]